MHPLYINDNIYYCLNKLDTSSNGIYVIHPESLVPHLVCLEKLQSAWGF